MRILLVNKYHFVQGGADRAYLDMGDILRRAGHEVAFFSMRHPKNIPTEWDKYFVSNVEYGDSEEKSIEKKFRLMSRIFWNREAVRNMERLIRDFHPDIAHLHNIYHQLSPSILVPLQKARIPAVMTLHDYKLISPNYNLFVRGKIWEETKNGAYWKCVRDRCVKDSYGKSFICATEAYVHGMLGAYDSIQMFFSPSRFLMEKFREFGWKKNMEYLPNPLTSFPENISNGHISKDAPFVFIGRLSAEKGVDMLFHALKKLGGSSKLHIIGDGPERKNLEILSVELGLSDRVIFRGYLFGNDLERERRESRAIFLPSVWYENMPYALTEALAEGQIVIATRQGGIPERVRDGENGLLFDLGNTDSLIEKIHFLETMDDEANEAMRRVARMSVDDLRESVFVERLEAMYQGILQGTKE